MHWSFVPLGVGDVHPPCPLKVRSNISDIHGVRDSHAGLRFTSNNLQRMLWQFGSQGELSLIFHSNQQTHTLGHIFLTHGLSSV